MKNLKKIIASSLVVCCAMLVGCQTTQNNDNTNNDLTIGVIQFGSHPSLDNCYTGVENILNASDKNITIDKQDGNFDPATCDTIAKTMVSKNYDLIVAIATPAAVSAYGATLNTEIPVVFCAVSDPIEAGLVEDIVTPNSTITGTSDVLDLSAQLTLIKALQPDATKIGVLYTTSEANSISNLKRLNEIASDFGVEIISQGVQTAADIPQAAATLAPKVDAINNFTDNNVVNNLSVLLEQANLANIPVYGSEVEQVENGCLASVSIDYIALGEKTGNMAMDILNGSDIKTMSITQIEDATPVINKQVLDQFSITIPDSLNDAQIIGE